MTNALLKTLFIGLFSFCACAFADDGRGMGRNLLTDGQGQFNLYNESHALLIGNIHYQHWNDLPAIKQELNAMKDLLTEQGFQVHSYWDLNSEQLLMAI